MKHKTTFEKLPQTNVGRSKNWKTLRAICLLLFLSVSFTAYSQITVNVKDISLRASLKKIEQVSNYKFFYNESLPELNQKVSLNVKDATIEQTMQQLLGKMELTYKKEQENVIVLIRKPQEKQRNIKVSGTVVDSNGEPIIGASVVVKGTSNGTITDLDGNFSINDVSETSQLTVSYIGYKPVQLRATDKNMAKVVLQEDSKMIEEVVVVGYTPMRKSDFTGSLASVKASELSLSAATAGQALVGKVAGVQVMQTSGAPGEGVKIKVRGTNSLSASTTPLYVIDGYPESVAWRQKEQFSDGVGYSWIDTLREITAAAVSDQQMEHAAERFPINTPQNKEEYYYRSIFEEHFPSESAARTVPSVPSVACSTAEALAWDIAFRNLNEPSGRAVRGIHEEAYT